jgi:glycosidase
MRGGEDPDNRRDFPGGWPGDPRNAFEAAGRTADENRLFDRVRRLAHLRRQSEALRRGRTEDLFCDDHTYAFARIAGGDRAIAVFHEGAGAEKVRIPAGLPDGSRLIDAVGSLPPVVVSKGSVELQMPAQSAALYVLR